MCQEVGADDPDGEKQFLFVLLASVRLQRGRHSAEQSFVVCDIEEEATCVCLLERRPWLASWRGGTVFGTCFCFASWRGGRVLHLGEEAQSLEPVLLASWRGGTVFGVCFCLLDKR